MQSSSSQGSEEATDRTEGNHSSLDQYNADTSYVLDSIEGKSLKKGIAPFGKETVDQLTKLYNQGMIGIGLKYQDLIDLAVAKTGLNSHQVKVWSSYCIYQHFVTQSILPLQWLSVTCSNQVNCSSHLLSSKCPLHSAFSKSNC